VTLPHLYLGPVDPAFPRPPIRWLSPDLDQTGIAWAWPEQGKDRARKLLSRAAMRPIYRFTSLKMGRSIHMESALEQQVAMLLDACPTIEAFGEQPATIHFDNGEGIGRHIPDFAVTQKGRPWFLELKFSKDVDAPVLARTERLTDLLCPLGIGYRLLTEKHVTHGPRLANAWALLQRARQSVNPHQSLMTHQRVAHTPGVSLGELGWGTPLRTASLARDLIQGRFHVNFGQAITSDTCAWPTHVEGGWLWA